MPFCFILLFFSIWWRDDVSLSSSWHFHLILLAFSGHWSRFLYRCGCIVDEEYSSKSHPPLWCPLIFYPVPSICLVRWTLSLICQTQKNHLLNHFEEVSKVLLSSVLFSRLFFVFLQLMYVFEWVALLQFANHQPPPMSPPRFPTFLGNITCSILVRRNKRKKELNKRCFADVWHECRFL